MSAPYLKLVEGDGIAVVFKNHPYNPTPVTVTNSGTPVMVMRLAEIEGIFVEWVRDGEGDPVGVVFNDLNNDTYCLPLATLEEHGGVYVKKLHAGAIEKLKVERAQVEAAQEKAVKEAEEAAAKATKREPAVVLARSMPKVP